MNAAYVGPIGVTAAATWNRWLNGEPKPHTWVFFHTSLSAWVGASMCRAVVDDFGTLVRVEGKS